jgi:hypothetical protein
MAGNFSLNTAAHPTLSQVLVALSDGTVFDYKAQQAAGKVDLAANPIKQAAARNVPGPGGVKALSES